MPKSPIFIATDAHSETHLWANMAQLGHLERPWGRIPRLID